VFDPGTGSLTKEEVLKKLGDAAPLIRSYGVRRIGIFGSVVRGQAGRTSDVDVLVEFSEKTFDNYYDLKWFLETLLGRRVDLVIAEDVKPRLKPQILREVEYAQGF
jgi:predicted nucleotidyltransferase